MDLSNVTIREAKAGDFNDMMDVEKQAFGYDK